MKPYKKLSMTILFAAALGCGIFALPNHAFACFGSSCESLDPVVTGCDQDATTLASKPLLDSTPDGSRVVSVGGVVLFYSPACHSKWAKIESFAPGRNLASVEISNSTTELQSVGRMGRGAQTLYTKMTNGSLPVHACGDIFWLSLPQQSGSGCTANY